jgi:hypothetical protein
VFRSRIDKTCAKRFFVAEETDAVEFHCHEIVMVAGSERIIPIRTGQIDVLVTRWKEE